MNTNIFHWNKITFYIHYEGLKLMTIERTSKKLYNQAEKIYEKNIWNQTKSLFYLKQQDGAAEACWAHNPVVGTSKLPPAKRDSWCAKSHVQHPYEFSFISNAVSSKFGKIKATEQQIQLQFGNQTARKISADFLQTNIKYSLIFLG